MGTPKPGLDAPRAPSRRLGAALISLIAVACGESPDSAPHGAGSGIDGVPGPLDCKIWGETAGGLSWSRAESSPDVLCNNVPYREGERMWINSTDGPVSFNFYPETKLGGPLAAVPTRVELLAGGDAWVQDCTTDFTVLEKGSSNSIPGDDGFPPGPIVNVAGAVTCGPALKPAGVTKAPSVSLVQPLRFQQWKVWRAAAAAGAGGGG